jgi:hypothetical protein
LTEACGRDSGKTLPLQLGLPFYLALSSRHQPMAVTSTISVKNVTNMEAVTVSIIFVSRRINVYLR